MVECANVAPWKLAVEQVAPFKFAPRRLARSKSEPRRFAPAKFAISAKTSLASVLSRFAPAKRAFRREVLSPCQDFLAEARFNKSGGPRLAPDKFVCLKFALSKQAPLRSQPVRSAPSKFAPSSFASLKSAPFRRTSRKSTPERSTSLRSIVEISPRNHIPDRSGSANQRWPFRQSFQTLTPERSFSSCSLFMCCPKIKSLGRLTSGLSWELGSLATGLGLAITHFYKWDHVVLQDSLSVPNLTD